MDNIYLSHLTKYIKEGRVALRNGHSKLFRVVDNLAIRKNDDELDRLFRSASALHTNFYENWLQKEK